MKKRYGIETSKKILLASYIIGIVLAVIVVIGTFMGFDMGNVTTITGAAWLEIAASNVYYYKKASKENVPKVLASFAPELLNQVDINQLLNN